jgi:hypothetical protein
MKKMEVTNRRENSTRFSLNGRSVTELSRQLYWDEQKKEKGYNLLFESFEEITDAQINAILNGEAYLTPGCEYIEEPDTEFKEYLKEQKDYIQTHFYCIGGKYVDRKLLSGYILDVCRPLINQARARAYTQGPFVAETLMERIDNLILTRDILLERVMESAGFGNRDAEGYTAFLRELDRLTDRFAGTMAEPSSGFEKDLTPEEIALYNDLRSIKMSELASPRKPYFRVGSFIPEFSKEDLPPSSPALMGEGEVFFLEFAETLHTISECQEKKYNGELSPEDYLQVVTPLCLDKIFTFIAAVHQYGAPTTEPSATLFENLCLNASVVQATMSNLSECSQNAVLLFELVRGFLHKDEELSVKFLRAYPITGNLKKDREIVIEFHDLMNESTEKAQKMLTERTAKTGPLL